MKKYYSEIFVGIIIEIGTIGIGLAFDYFHQCTLYIATLYLIPLVRIIGSKPISYFDLDNALLSKSIFLLIFLINSIKWMVIIGVYKRGYRKIAFLLAIPFIAAIIIYFPFSKLGF